MLFIALLENVDILTGYGNSRELLTLGLNGIMTNGRNKTIAAILLVCHLVADNLVEWLL